VVGQVPEELSFSFSECPAAGHFKFQPAVLKGLSMPVNFSQKFMALHGWDQLHSQGCIRIEDHKVPMITKVGYRPHSSSKVYTTTSSIIAPRSWATIPIKMRQFGLTSKNIQLRQGQLPKSMLAELRRLTPAEILQSRTNQDRVIISCLRIFNPTNHIIRLPQGRQIASLDRSIPAGLAAGAQPAAKDETADSSVPTTPAGVRSEFERLFQEKGCALTTASEKKVAIDLVMDFIDVFSLEGEFGKTSLVKHAIHTGDAIPIKCASRPVNPALSDNLRAQLDEWLKHDVIEESTSPWASALVPVQKKNGKVRWCADFRFLNGVTIKDAYPLPSIADNLARLADSAVFTALDGSGAFHVVELEDEAKPKTAFTTPWGLFQFKRMPFGLCNAPATYSRLVQHALRHIPSTQALCYLDDTLVHSATVTGHFIALRRVLEAHRSAGLKLQPSKCKWFATEVTYVGHQISAQGVAPMPKYLEAVKEWPMPRTLTELRAFLGKTGYYRRFIKDYAAIARPLTDATKAALIVQPDGTKINPPGKTPLEITKAMQGSHQALKSALCSSPILAFPRFCRDSPFIVDTDWSHENNAIGGVLSQVQDRKERVIAYGAKKLTPSQSNYAATKGELFAIIFFLRHWRYFLQWQPFILRTDHRALVWIKTMEAPTGMVARWLDTLANFEFTPVYRKGSAHGNADGLSRASHITEMIDGPSEDDVIFSIGPGDPTAATLALPMTPEAWAGEQQQDVALRPILEALHDQRWPQEANWRRSADPRTKVLYDARDRLRRDSHGVLLFTHKESIDGATSEVPVVPYHLEKPFIQRAHELCGHRGQDATHITANRTGLCLRGRALVAEVVEQCLACQAKQDLPPGQRHTYRTVMAGEPWERLSIDYVGPLRRTKRGNEYLFTVKDVFSKWVEAFPVPRATAEAACRCLHEQIITRYGFPQSIHSDRANTFMGHVMQETCRLLQIKHTATPAYHPQSNPVERAHRDLKSGLRAALEEVEHEEWDEILPDVLFAFRMCPARGTGLSPFKVLFGKDPALPTSYITTPEKVETPIIPYVDNLRRRMTKVHQYAREHLSREVHRQTRAYQGSLKSELPQRVRLHHPGGAEIRRGERKLRRPWTGPWVIVKRPSPVYSIIRWEADPDGPTYGVANDRLMPYGDGKQVEDPYAAPKAEDVEIIGGHHPWGAAVPMTGVQRGGDSQPNNPTRMAEEDDDDDFQQINTAPVFPGPGNPRPPSPPPAPRSPSPPPAPRGAPQPLPAGRNRSPSPPAPGTPAPRNRPVSPIITTKPRYSSSRNRDRHSPRRDAARHELLTPEVTRRVRTEMVTPDLPRRGRPPKPGAPGPSTDEEEMARGRPRRDAARLAQERNRQMARGAIRKANLN